MMVMVRAERYILTEMSIEFDRRSRDGAEESECRMNVHERALIVIDIRTVLLGSGTSEL